MAAQQAEELWRQREQAERDAMKAKREIEALKRQLDAAVRGEGSFALERSFASDATGARLDASFSSTATARRKVVNISSVLEEKYQREQEEMQQQMEERERLHALQQHGAAQCDEHEAVHAPAGSVCAHAHDDCCKEDLGGSPDEAACESEDEADDLPPELLEKLQQLSAVLIQRTYRMWRAQRKQADGVHDAETFGTEVHAELDVARTDSGTGQAKDPRPGKSRTTAAHTTLGADADDVNASIRALQVLPFTRVW